MASLSFKRRQQLKNDPTKLQDAQLSEEQWRTWLQEEVGMATDRNKKTAVVPIFEAAVTVDLWLLYCRFILDDMRTYLEVRREAPEYAEDPVLAFPDGIMAGFRRAFLTMAEMPVTARRAAFLELLRTPHRALSDLFLAYSRLELAACNNVAAEYEAYMAEGNALYQATLALTADLEQYETALTSSSGDDRTAAATAYIEHVKQLIAADQLSADAIPAIYERAVTEWCAIIDAFHAVSLEGVWALERCGLGTQSVLETAMEMRAQKFPNAVPSSFALNEWCLHWIARGKADPAKEVVLVTVIEFVKTRCTAATWARMFRNLTALLAALLAGVPDLVSTETTRALFHAVLGKLVDDPTPVPEVMLVWEYAHGTMSDVETVAAQIDYYRAYYAQYYQYIAVAAAPEPDADVVMADAAAPAPAPALRREKRKGADSALADRDSKRTKPAMTDEAKIEKLNCTVLVKHASPDQEGRVCRVFEPFGTIRDVRFLPCKAEGR
ncbi:hypothetical protein AMAG_19773 [Allomyces macrogynus ATCC 38327]|uniref:Uncharacterized protein n=1 Tax=Allomyces macrogynus (strain ATCC 38327) TaxID=578462 RepID=A0A0L0T1S0_ALLM3|nr:hypothetical protein AMAG_19773 [Allomyces macrogynus ATCC 38327]|eukprot:KNE68682.1 hypothetical protein AMAG_19773 [Allomyces macrogynus ATCC 38327]